MKLKYIIENLDKSQPDIHFDIEPLLEDLGIDGVISSYQIQPEEHKLVSYEIGQWFCTDDVVGHHALFLDGEFIATTSQTGRKSDVVVYWKDEPTANKVRKHLLSLIPEDNTSNLQYCDMERDHGDGYNVQFPDELMNGRLTYKGKSVVIVKQFPLHGFNMCDVLVRDVDGNEHDTTINDILISWNVKQKGK